MTLKAMLASAPGDSRPSLSIDTDVVVGMRTVILEEAEKKLKKLEEKREKRERRERESLGTWELLVLGGGFVWM